MNRAAVAAGLVALGLLALGLRVWTVLALCNGDSSPHPVLWLQCLAGTALVLVVAWLGWSLVPDRPSVGWVAALALAAYPPQIHLVAQPQVDCWSALVLTLLLAVVAAPGWQASRRGALLAGALAGALVWLEPLLAAALPIAAAVFWLAGGTGSGRFSSAVLGRVALLLATTAVVVAPGLIRNRVVHGQFVLLRIDGPQDPSALAEAAKGQPEGQVADKAPRDPELPFGMLYLWRLRPALGVDEAAGRFAGRMDRLATVAWLVLAAIGLSVSRDRWRGLWPTYAVVVFVGLLPPLIAPVDGIWAALQPMTFLWVAGAVAPLLVRMVPQRQIKVYRPGQQARDPFDSEHSLQAPHYDVAVRRRAG